MSENPVAYSEEGSVPLEADIATSPEVISDPKMRTVAEVGDRVKEAIISHLCDCPNRQLALRYIDLAVQASRDCNRTAKSKEARQQAAQEHRAALRQDREGRRRATGRPENG